MSCIETVAAAAVEVRLTDSYNSKQGRLEVLYRGLWGAVCSDDFDDNAAKVACYMLGYGYDFLSM